jgi:hypothetical protein
VLLVLIDPFLAVEKEAAKVYRSLHMREYSPSTNVTLQAVGHDISVDVLDSDTYTIKTDQNGFIIGPKDRDTNVLDIVFFGGSTVECAFVDDSLRFPYLVGQALGIVSRNAGYGGNHSFHSFNNLIGKGIPNQPKTVVLMHNINDLALLTKTGSYFEAPNNRRILNENRVDFQNGFKVRVQRLFSASVMATIPNIYGRITKASAAKNNEIDEWAGYRSAEKIDTAIIKMRFRNSLNSFIAVAKANQMEVVLMTQFNRMVLGDTEVEAAIMKKNTNYTFAEYVGLYNDFNEIIRQTAAVQNVLLIDLAREIPQTKAYLYDAVHVNNAGSKLVAEKIIKVLSAKF